MRENIICCRCRQRWWFEKMGGFLLKLHRSAKSLDPYCVCEKTLICREYWGGRLSTGDLLIKVDCFDKKQIISSIFKGADLNRLVQGGQLYRTFHFSKTSLLYVIYCMHTSTQCFQNVLTYFAAAVIYARKMFVFLQLRPERPGLRADVVEAALLQLEGLRGYVRAEGHRQPVANVLKLFTAVSYEIS